jgi:hypothetical protein
LGLHETIVAFKGFGVSVYGGHRPHEPVVTGEGIGVWGLRIRCHTLTPQATAPHEPVVAVEGFRVWALRV